MNLYKKIFFMLVILILINSCAIKSENISCKSKEEAKAIAIGFVKEKVKFFAKQEDSEMDLPQYDIGSVTSYQEDGNWVVLMHVSAELGDEVKDNDLVIKINKKCEVIELNGKEIPKDY